jgi:smad nuclear-interacting protein 1
LAKYAENAVGNGKVLKFTIPFDGKVPVANWQLFPFKGHEALRIFFK